MGITLLKTTGEEKAVQLKESQGRPVYLTVARERGYLYFSVVDENYGVQYDFDMGEGRATEFAMAFLGLKLEEEE